MEAQRTAAPHRHFFLKDLYDRGLHIARGVEDHHSTNSTDILSAFSAMDDAFAENGKPNYDLHVWMGLGRLLINAGDIVVAATRADVIWDHELKESNHWFFGLDLTDHPLANEVDERLRKAGDLKDHHRASKDHVVFLHLRRLEPMEQTVEEVTAYLKPDPQPLKGEEGMLTWKAMGAITAAQYISKLGAYPMSVHPTLEKRAVGNIHYMLIQSLSQAGLLVQEHWFPEDTSKGFARYHLTDGIEHFELDFYAPRLLQAVAAIDKQAGRDDADGGIVLDDESTVAVDAVTDNDGLPQ